MKKLLTEDEFLDMWLAYHGTTIKEVIETHPEWMENPERYTRTFYETYAVTQEQHDEWYDNAINRIAKYYRYSKKRAKRMFCWDYLNVAPSIKDK